MDGIGWELVSPAVDEAANASAPVAHGEAAASRKKLAIIGGAVGAVAIVVVAVLMLTGGGGDGSASGYPAAFERNFMDSCIESAGVTGARSLCECAYRTLQSEIPYEQVEEIDRSGRQLPSDIESLIRKECG